MLDFPNQSLGNICTHGFQCAMFHQLRFFDRKIGALLLLKAIDSKLRKFSLPNSSSVPFRPQTWWAFPSAPESGAARPLSSPSSSAFSSIRSVGKSATCR
jgi:hypothetical protein